ncbi:MAG: MaoC family dehydratase [Deltaproteobacteria bacterium]|nr:MaoC family dehydratase [Deltaproteobacteria bacterium]
MSNAAFTVPIEDRYFEDYVPGEVHESGSIEADEKEIIAFAQRFDPQPFHLDPVAARESIYGGLIASGWHTACLMMRLLVDHYISRVASLGSPGIDDLRWLKPVRPGDVLSVRVTILEAKRSRSKPDRGIVHSYIEVLNQDREIVMTVKTMNLLRCRDESTDPGRH